MNGQGGKTIRLSDDVLAVLRRSSITDGMLRLPAERLDRSLYTAVDKALQALGGKWNRKAGGHTFANPDALNDALASAIDEGAVVAPSKNGYFPTPERLARYVVGLAEIEADHLVLEPSVGQGHLADIVAEIVPKDQIVCIEPLDSNVSVLTSKGYALFARDFFECAPAPIFDRVVMNPPFERQADIAHVRRAFMCLKPGGRLVAIMSPGFTFRQDETARKFREDIERRGAHVEKNPDGSFRESGTDVSTVTVVIDRPEAS